MAKSSNYKNIKVADYEGGFALKSDNGFITSKQGRILKTLNGDLAEKIRLEWLAADGKGISESMPLTRYLVLMHDWISQDRESVIAQTIKYAETDLLCYRAKPSSILAQKQEEIWQPLLSWAGERYNAPLRTTAKVTVLPQSQGSLLALYKTVQSANDLALTGLYIATGISGSLIIALAMMDCFIDHLEAWNACTLEERWCREEVQ